MKILFIMAVTAFSFSCKTTKLAKDGQPLATANARHINKIHKNGFWTGKGYVRIHSSQIATVNK